MLIAAKISLCSFRVSRYEAVIRVLDFVTRSGLGSGLVAFVILVMIGYWYLVGKPYSQI
ncbi:hypothetical protein D3C85_1759550 [compost metagenome]